MGNTLKNTSVLETFRNRKFAMVAGLGISALALAGCKSTDTATAPNPQTSVDAVQTPQQEAPAQPKTSIPALDIKHTGVKNEADATALVEAYLSELSTSGEASMLTNALSGDYSDLEALHVNADELLANFELNKLFIEKGKKYIDEVRVEVKEYTKYDLTDSTESYDYARGANFLISKILQNYAQGNAPSLDTSYPVCVTSDQLDYKPTGRKPATGVYPPLGPFMMTKEVAVCEPQDPLIESLGDTMKSFIDESTPLLREDGTVNAAELNDIRYKILVGTDPEAAAAIANLG